MKKQSEALFRAIADVGDDLIARADAPVQRVRHIRARWAALAACCALVIGLAAVALPRMQQKTESAAADSAAPMLTAEAPAETEMVETAEAPETEMMEMAEAPAAAAPETMDDSEASAEKYAGETEGVVRAADGFNVRPETVTPTSAIFCPTTEITLCGGFTIERRTDDGWQALPLLTDSEPVGTLTQAEDGAFVMQADWQESYGALEAGEYRLVQDVLYCGGSTDADMVMTTVSALFTVE